MKVIVTGKDRYKRFLGFVEVDGINVNHQMVVRGLAWHYKEYSKDRQLAAAEDAAKKINSGLWSAYKPMAPWDYRKLKRGGMATTAINISTPSVTKVESSENKFWLNSSSNARHNISCRWYGKTKRGRYVSKSEGKACGQCGG